MNRASHKNAQKGFSLVELLIALTLGLLLTAAIGALFYANKKNFNQNRLIASMQDNARFALETVARDLAMAGYLGGITDENRLERTLASPTNDCAPGADGDAAHWAFDRLPIEFLDNPTPATAVADYGCLPGSNIKATSDVLSIRRVSGQVTAEVDSDADLDNLELDANTYYLRSNRTEGTLFFSGSDGVAPTDGAASGYPHTIWEYISRLYFIRDYAQEPGDNIPTLCRAVLLNGATTGIEVEVLAEGVEDLQLAFGIDENDDAIADTYAVAPSAAQLENAVTARVQLLVRSLEPDYSYQNKKTYRLLSKDDQSFPAGDEDHNDHFYRRVIQTTVILRNPALIQGLQP